MYNNYQVFGCGVNFAFMNHASAMSMLVALYPTRNVTPLTYDDALEQPYAKRAIVGPITAYNIRSIKTFCRIKKFIGRNTNSVNYTATVTGNPSNQLYWVITVISADSSTNLEYIINADFTMYCKFWNRKALLDV